MIQPRRWRWRTAGLGILAAAWACSGGEEPPGPSVEASATEFALALNAKLLCSGVFVQGRDPGTHLAEDVRPYPAFSWSDGFTATVDREAQRVTYAADGTPARTAQYAKDQGCVILPRSGEGLSFEPRDVGRAWPDAESVDWPTGERLPEGSPSAGVDVDALGAALDYAMDNESNGQNTRAVVVVHRGRLIGERYAPGIPRDMPHLSWSQGKSITAALVGVLVEQGAITLEQPLGEPLWSEPDDPRHAIRVVDALHMSSGLDFNNMGLSGPESLRPDNHHFRIYFDGIDVFAHAASRPLAVEPNTRWRYLNSDPLLLGALVRRTVEGRGESYHDFPWTALFDRIGMKHVVLETDAWGNFIMTGYDYASARDWARFGLLHLQDGVWEGERILPEGWSDLVSAPAPASETLDYGGLFWLNAGRRFPSIPTDAYWAAGFMGQTTMVIPSRELVVVRLGPSPGDFGPYLDRVVGEIVAAVASGSGS